jgi:hypothetical protein
MRLRRRNLAAVGIAILLLALVVPPAAGMVLATALVLTPVFLFGLVAAPRSLWPAADLEQRFAAPVLERAPLFQRPPPVSIL